MGALLHDVGMLLIPEEIRFKKGRLSKDEWYEVQKHAILGMHVLEKIPNLPESALYVAYQTHERENGKGYPKQRTGRFIHAFAKIVQVADVYESLCSQRDYRPPYLPYRAMELLIKMSVRNLLSIDFVKAFLAYASLFPIGSVVELSNHCIARVVQRTNFIKRNRLSASSWIIKGRFFPGKKFIRWIFRGKRPYRSPEPLNRPIYRNSTSCSDFEISSVF